MNAAEIIIIIMASISLLLAARQHGEDKEGQHNFWLVFLAAFIQIGLMYWAGLFH